MTLDSSLRPRLPRAAIEGGARAARGFAARLLDRAACGPPAMGGGSADAEDQLARWMERAASHQTRALAWLRQARDPAMGPLGTARRRDLLLRALEHLVSARRLLQRARESADATAELCALLDAHLARLESTTSQTERLLHDLDATVEG